MSPDTKTKILIKETVRETLLTLGYNIDDPDELLEHQKDKHYIRAERLRKEGMENKAWNHVMVMVLSAIGAAFILGIAQALGLKE